MKCVAAYNFISLRRKSNQIAASSILFQIIKSGELLFYMNSMFD